LLATQPVVRIQDSGGNTVTSSSATVTVAIQSGAGGTLGGTLTVTAVNGVATFTNLTLAGVVGTGYVLEFSATGPTPAASGSVTVSSPIQGLTSFSFTTASVSATGVVTTFAGTPGHSTPRISEAVSVWRWW
jgi:hypothetical protein